MVLEEITSTNTPQQAWYLEKVLSTSFDMDKKKHQSMSIIPEGLNSGLKDVEYCYGNFIDKNDIGTIEIQMGLANVGVRELYKNPHVSESIEFVNNTRRTKFGDTPAFRNFENFGEVLKFKHPLPSKTKNSFGFYISEPTERQLGNRASDMKISKNYLLCMSLVYGCLVFLDNPDLQTPPRPNNLILLKDEWANFIWQLDTHVLKFQLDNVEYDHTQKRFINPISTKCDGSRYASTNEWFSRYISTYLPVDTFSYCINNNIDAKSRLIGEASCIAENQNEHTTEDIEGGYGGRSPPQGLDTIKIRIITEIPKFSIGTIVYDLKQGDIVELPKVHANNVIEKGYGVLVGV